MIEETIGMKIAGANWDGDIDFLNEMAESGQFDPLKITPTENWNYLHLANVVNPSPEETVQFYLDKGVEVNAQDCYGMTPLHYAVRVHNLNAVLILLKAGADPNIQNQDSNDSLWQSILQIPCKEDVPIIEELIKYDAKPHKKNKYGVSVFDNLKRYAKSKSYLIDLVRKLDGLN